MCCLHGGILFINQENNNNNVTAAICKLLLIVILFNLSLLMWNSHNLCHFVRIGKQNETQGGFLLSSLNTTILLNLFVLRKHKAQRCTKS